MSTYSKELSYDQEIDTVRGIKFSVLSPDEITRRSVIEVTKNDTFAGNEPVVGGLFDPRMGVLETNRTCCTCQQKNLFCPGHFGHINMARPIFHPMFFDTVRKLLKCVCFRCSRPLVSKRSTRADLKTEVARIGAITNSQKRWDALLKLHTKIKLKRCGDDHLASDEENSGCQALQPTRYQKESSGIRINADWKEAGGDTTQREFTAEDILRIFRRITDADMVLMGFDPRWNKPEWMICTVLPVPPPAVRPSIIEESGQRREDDLTHKLCDIVKFNTQLQQKIDSGKASEENLKVLTNLVQYHVATFMNNQMPGMPVAQQRNGRKLKSIADRLKKKDGRIRGNLNGKRVDQSARSVITPDPYISLDELGVPIRIAMNLTFPETVNVYNKAWLQGLVRAGVDEWPGAKFVRRSSDGVTLSLKYADRDKIAEELQIGDTVDRHMIDGDFVLFNRQPSLHKMSMMGFKVRVMKYQTFRLPVLATGCFNADFDGDEMNLFKPQNVQTMSEIKDITAIPFLIINPRDGKPIVEVIQDTMVGSYRITSDWATIDDKTMANLQMVNSYFTGVMPAPEAGKYTYRGKQAFSLMLPPGLFIKMKNKAGETFKISDSIITEGTVDKSVFHSMSKGIIPVLFHDYSPFEVRRFLDNTQRLMCRWLVTGGFSVGISDIIVEPAIAEKIRATISKYKGEAYKKFNEIRNGSFENSSIFNNEDNFEREILNVLNGLNKELGHVKLDEKTNRMINMIKSGSKGKEENVAQMVAAVGQQNVDGKRVAYGFTDRTLPHYTKYDDGPEARGFVENSFINGLTPQEVFFHAMGGREGLIDTAVKSVTGDTPIVVMEDGVCRTVNIGDWIDSLLDDDKNKSAVEHYEARQMEMFHLQHDVYIPTMDDDGVVTWGEMTAVTRHDPGTELYEIKTMSGKSVIVTESKSLLIWNADKKQFLEKPTPEVKLGDYVPVTATLCKPPIIVSYVDMTEYFPKDEYVHGTEFHKAVEAMKAAQGDKDKIPRGWWAANNGKSFITPYPKKSLVQRMISGRSNTENIKDGCIYPYHAKRDACLIPDKFELTYDNGVFIGLYLADGHSDEASGHVGISKEETGVIQFTQAWFAKYSIVSKVIAEQKERGVSTSVRGNSTLLARFMNKFVGKGSRNKYVPDIAFNAPQEFVTGIISGYFSGDGSVSDNSVTAASTSRRLLDGIAMLLSRLGIFSYIYTYPQQASNNLGTLDIGIVHGMTIRSHWAGLFAYTIQLVNVDKQKKLKTMTYSETHQNYKAHNDVVLDQITEINIIGIEKYPKVYDVTVPSTLNFMLANGLGCQDTSETGYVQRRLVKALEDAKVYYDQTVRNATGALVQYLYGEDGMDGTKIEKQHLPYINMNIIEMDIHYHLRGDDPLSMYLTDDAMKQLAGVHWISRCTDHFNQLEADRHFLITTVFKGLKQDKIEYPIAFERIINTAMQRLAAATQAELVKTPTDLTPTYILDKIDDLIDRLYVIRKNQGIRFLHILLRMHLSPKPIIFNHNMSKPIFDWIVEEIERKFIEAVVHPGEMVGVVAAQSIGELGTQQSSLYETRIIITTANGIHYKCKIGEFIDNLIENNKDNVLDIGGDSCVLTMEAGKNDFKIIGISQDEKTSWNRILEVSRHPAKGGVMKVTTKSGKTTTATLSHSFLKRAEKGIVAVLGSDLTVGDRIPVARYIPEVADPLKEVVIGGLTYALDHEFGWICGAYLADGISISKVEPVFEQRIRTFAEKYNHSVHVNNSSRFPNEKFTYMTLDPNKQYPSKSTIMSNKPLQEWIESTFGRGSYKKSVGGLVFASNKKFIAGIISGYFDGDGSISVSKQTIRAHSVNEGLIDDIIVLLAYHGIFASKLKQDRKREKATLMWEVSVTKKFAPIFKESIGLYTPHKADNLDKILTYLNEVKTKQDYIDMIPELGGILDFLGKRLELPGQSRTFAIFKRLGINRVGREALVQYIHTFEEAAAKTKLDMEVSDAIAILKQAAAADAVYDEIVSIEYLPDPKKYVYDFTVPGNDSFMVDAGVLVHNTLDSFHSSGTAAAVKATSGVPRLKELLSVSKNIKTPAMFIYMKPDIGTVVNPVEDEEEDDDKKVRDPRIQEAKERSMKVQRQLEVARIVDILDSTEIYWDPPGSDGLASGIQGDNGMLEVYRQFSMMDTQRCRSTSPWVLRIKIDKEKLYKIGLTMMDIYMRLYTSYSSQIDCVFSDDNAQDPNLRVRLKTEALKDVAKDDTIAALKAMEYNLVHSVLLKGIKGVKKVAMRPMTIQKYNDDTNGFDNITEWILDTDGTNLQEILANPNVDSRRTVSNDVYEVMNTLGIEAARNIMHKEFGMVVGDDKLNYRHMSLLLDTMTNRGTLMSVDRHGINRGDIGPLAKSSFEETTDMLIDASIFSQHDRINGVSANIMLGQVPPCGTGDHEVYIDEVEYVKLMKEYRGKQPKYVAPQVTPITHAPVVDEIITEDSCASSSLAFSFKLPPKKVGWSTPLPTVVFK